jgi:hypothetical protein
MKTGNKMKTGDNMRTGNKMKTSDDMRIAVTTSRQSIPSHPYSPVRSSPVQSPKATRRVCIG